MLNQLLNKEGYRFRILNSNKIMVSKDGSSGIMVTLKFDKSKRSLFAD